MKGYESIGPYGQKVFARAHAAHLATMGSQMREEYTLDQVKLIKANNKERCIEVKYKNGDWYKYFPDGTWG